MQLEMSAFCNKKLLLLSDLYEALKLYLLGLLLKIALRALADWYT